MRIPDRVAWTVELLDVERDDRIIEIGCGVGTAVHLVASRLSDGLVMGIDRSATAIARAAARNADHVASGKAVLRESDLAGFDAGGQKFDKAFAVNVNVFWTSDADAECAVLSRLVRRGGVLLLVYDAPSAGRTRSIGPDIVRKLDGHGFRSEVIHDGSRALVCVAARLT